ncbi:hypothetical protein GCM10010172_65790 [Paractinoplanes ferrugineus]|uniref:Transglutaminase-like domain-containing protein n=2 Tax=Paractinoplanes ferrugineus TaxID=113564 RepID=A0A919MI30_9ACTN|nr:hypothetical protein Afe05nite_51000 [Actinoplanes ferrugineus]
MERILLVPDGAREFTEDLSDVRIHHRIRAALLQQLLDLGLPHRGTGEEMRFDKWDMANVGVSLGLPCPRRLAMRWWSKALAETPTCRSIGYTLEVAARCPDPGHAEPCEFSLSPEFQGAARVRAVRSGVYSCEIGLPGGLRYFGDPFTDLFASVLDIRFHLLPVALSDDLGFVAETNLADCRAATMHLLRQARERELPVRTAVGYFVAPPYATPHAWIECQLEDAWWPADPFLLNALIRWQIIDPSRWPVNRSPQALLWPLHKRHFVAMTHRGAEVYPTVAMTERRLSG